MLPEKISPNNVVEIEMNLKDHPEFIDAVAGESETKAVFYVTSQMWNSGQKITCGGFIIPLNCQDFEVVAHDYELKWNIAVKRDRIYRRFYRSHYRVRHVRERQIQRWKSKLRRQKHEY